MIKDYDRVIGKRDDGLTIIGTVVNSDDKKNKDRIIAIEDEKTYDVHLFYESEVTPYTE